MGKVSILKKEKLKKFFIIDNSKDMVLFILDFMIVFILLCLLITVGIEFQENPPNSPFVVFNFGISVIVSCIILIRSLFRMYGIYFWLGVILCMMALITILTHNPVFFKPLWVGVWFILFLSYSLIHNLIYGKKK